MYLHCRSPKEAEHQMQKPNLANQKQSTSQPKINYSEIIPANNYSLEELSPSSYSIGSLLGKEVPRNPPHNSTPFHHGDYSVPSPRTDHTYLHSHLPSSEAPIQADYVQPANQSLPLLSHDRNYEATQYQSTYLPTKRPSQLDGSPSDRESLTSRQESPSDRNAHVRGGQESSDWNDMDFLEDVLEDVLSHRQEQERNVTNNQSPYLMAKANRTDVFPSSQYGKSAAAPYRGYVSQTGQGGRYLEPDEGSESSSDVSVTSISQWSEVDRGRSEFRTGFLMILNIGVKFDEEEAISIAWGSRSIAAPPPPQQGPGAPSSWESELFCNCQVTVANYIKRPLHN